MVNLLKIDGSKKKNIPKFILRNFDTQRKLFSKILLAKYGYQLESIIIVTKYCNKYKLYMEKSKKQYKLDYRPIQLSLKLYNSWTWDVLLVQRLTERNLLRQTEGECCWYKSKREYINQQCWSSVGLEL